MSAVPADVLVKREVVNEALDPRRTESKFSLAMDAVTKDKSHAGKSVKAYLDVLQEVLNSFPVVQSREGVFDARILVTVDATRNFINQYRNLVVIVAEAKNADDFTSHLSAFLEGVLSIKKHYPIGDTAGYLWRDSLGFMAREIFVSTIAALLANNRWRSVRNLLDYQYSVPQSNAVFDYCAFDGFQRSLDVFRNRRLKLQRLSVAADLLKERIQESALTFEQVMQADFVMHIYSLMRNCPSMHTWHARTLGFADAQILSGFDLFVDVRAGKARNALTTLFDVADWTQLRHKLDAVVNESAQQDPDKLDYAGFIAANNAIFAH